MILMALTIIAASPATIGSAINAAKPGDTIRLLPATYSQVVVRGRTFDPPLSIDGQAATLAGIAVFNSTGVRWTGGTIIGNLANQPVLETGVFVQLSSAITVHGVQLSNFRNGIIYDRVVGGEISNNWATRMTTDGIDLALSRQINVTGNACTDFRPSEGAHPDCIQLWSRPGSPPVADVVIRANTAVGTMQGISLFNHVRNGINDGGFDRITISNNNVLNTYAGGISVYDCRGCVVRANDVASLPYFINGAQLYVSGGSVVVCGNVVTMVPRQAGSACAN